MMATCYRFLIERIVWDGDLQRCKPGFFPLSDRLRFIINRMKPYGESWRQHRKLLHQFLNVRDQQTNRDIQRRAVHEFLKRLGANSENFLDQTKQ